MLEGMSELGGVCRGFSHPEILIGGRECEGEKRVMVTCRNICYFYQNWHITFSCATVSLLLAGAVVCSNNLGPLSLWGCWKEWTCSSLRLYINWLMYN